MTKVRPGMLAGVVLCSLFGGCSTVRSSSMPSGARVAPAYEGQVAVRATSVPEGAHELGIVEAHATDFAEFPALIERLRSEVAALGGDFAKIDDVRTKFELVKQSQSYSYKCGESTCSGTRWVTVEVGTTTVQGRAFSTR